MTPEDLTDRLRTERDEALDLRTALLGNTWDEQATPEQTSAAVELLEGLAALMDETVAYITAQSRTIELQANDLRSARVGLERLTGDKAGFLGAP